jgi:hypothetical protein
MLRVDAVYRVRRANEVAAVRRVQLVAPAVLVAIGSLGLAVGLLVYMTDRDAAQAMLFPTIAALDTGAVFGVLGPWLPSFVHTFAFSLFTAAALPWRCAWRYGACAAWCAVNVAFEMAQHPQVSARLAEALEGGFGLTSLTRPLANFFLRGTFDGADIAAALVGALAAAAVLRMMNRIWETDHGR